MNRLLPNTAFKQRLADRLCVLLHDFSVEKMGPRIDSLASLIRPNVQADTKKFYTNSQFEQNLTQDLITPGGPQGPFEIAGLNPFITARRASLLGQLAPFGCTATAVLQAREEMWKVFPNPSGGRIFVRDEQGNLNRICLYELQGRLLKTWEMNSGAALLELEGIPAGVYLLKMESRDAEFVIKKIVVQ